jgi:nicotinate-nucleotide adenylyltransferase
MGGPALGDLTGTPPDGAATPVRPGSIGLLGGTFDPFHVGHLALARAARDQLGLERVLLAPAGQPPHKPGRPISPARLRLAMVIAGISGEPRLEASRIEIDRPGPSFTVDTVAELLAATPLDRSADVVVILSADSFAGLASWHQPERLVALARFAVAPRAGHPVPDVDELDRRLPGLAGRVDRLDLPPIVVSASEIRRRAAAGDPLDGLVPPAVATLIADNGLYRQHQPQETDRP